MKHNEMLPTEEQIFEGREMSKEEQNEWDALADNFDWMTDEQIVYEGDKIRLKYGH